MADKHINPTYNSLVEVTKALNEAEVPMKDRYGYMVMNDGSVKKFGPITYYNYVLVTNKPSKTKIHKVK